MDDGTRDATTAGAENIPDPIWSPRTRAKQLKYVRCLRTLRGAWAAASSRSNPNAPSKLGDGAEFDGRSPKSAWLVFVSPCHDDGDSFSETPSGFAMVLNEDAADAIMVGKAARYLD